MHGIDSKDSVAAIRNSSGLSFQESHVLRRRHAPPTYHLFLNELGVAVLAVPVSVYFGVLALMFLRIQRLPRWCPILPRRSHLMTVFGAPLTLPKLPNPSRDDVERWHRTYVEVRMWHAPPSFQYVMCVQGLGEENLIVLELCAKRAL